MTKDGENKNNFSQIRARASNKNKSSSLISDRAIRQEQGGSKRTSEQTTSYKIMKIKDNKQQAYRMKLLLMKRDDNQLGGFEERTLDDNKWCPVRRVQDVKLRLVLNKQQPEGAPKGLFCCCDHMVELDNNAENERDDLKRRWGRRRRGHDGIMCSLKSMPATSLALLLVALLINSTQSQEVRGKFLPFERQIDFNYTIV